MTNPAEKIRQVVEGHIEALDGIELYKGGKRTSMCLVSTAKQSTLYMAESILNAIIEEMEIDMRHKDSLQAMVIAEQRDKLKEARTSLTTIL